MAACVWFNRYRGLIMYSTTQEVQDMIKPDMVNSIVDDMFPEDEEDEAQKLIKLTEIIEAAIKDADAEIDGYLNKRYPTPIPSPPAVINKLSKDIALYNILSRKGMLRDERENNYFERYKYAIKFLENVAKGIADIGITVPAQKANTGFNITSNTKIFGRNNMNGM